METKRAPSLGNKTCWLSFEGLGTTAFLFCFFEIYKKPEKFDHLIMIDDNQSNLGLTDMLFVKFHCKRF